VDNQKDNHALSNTAGNGAGSIRFSGASPVGILA
jgi:hypothetical protein